MNSESSLVLGCYFDPRESFYNAGFEQNPLQWSYDFDSTLKALENFINGVGTYTDVTVSVTALLANVSAVIVKYDEESFKSLLLASEKQNKTPEVLLREMLKVRKVQIVAVGDSK